MRCDSPTRASLRAATADAHARVDRIFTSFDLAQRAGYARFLQAQAAALLPLEQALEAGAAPRLAVEWTARRRGPALVRDLRAWDLPVPANDGVDPIERPAAALGTLYVLEGSRLGGAVIRRTLPPEFPSAFLAPGPPGHWRTLLDALETCLPTHDLRSEAIDAAQAAFALFECSARAFSPEIA